MRVALATTSMLVLAFLALPILVVVPLSFSSSDLLAFPIPAWSWRWYNDFFTTSRWIEATRNSFAVALATMLLSTALGTAAALGLHRGRFRGKAALLALLTTPLVVPIVITGVSIYLAFAAIGLANSFAGLILAHTILAAPAVVITVLATLQGFDIDLVRAAASLGASPWMAFRRVTLPLIAPGVIGGALLAFATSFDELVVTIFVAGPDQFTLPRQMYGGLREYLSPTICAAATLVIVISVALMAFAELIRRRGEAMRAAPSAHPARHDG